MLLFILVACPGTQEDSGPPPVADSCLPIEAGYANVEPILIEACGDCHGTEPRYGAPYSLVDGYEDLVACLLYTSPSPRDQRGSRMPSSA